MLRRLAGNVGAALLLSAIAIPTVGRLGRDWEARVAVRGHSMEPTLSDGDWLLVDARAYERRAPRPGELVVARDPRVAGRVLVKRAAGVMADGAVMLGSERPDHASDQIGPVATTDILGRPWFRYWPMERAGRIS